MMTHTIPVAGQNPVSSIQSVIAQYGAWPVLRAALLALLNRSNPQPKYLSDHIRRDIGLPANLPPQVRVPLPPWV
jgi:hypothetical protein